MMGVNVEADAADAIKPSKSISIENTHTFVQKNTPSATPQKRLTELRNPASPKKTPEPSTDTEGLSFQGTPPTGTWCRQYPKQPSLVIQEMDISKSKKNNHKN
jgi:hypothetical protein